MEFGKSYFPRNAGYPAADGLVARGNPARAVIPIEAAA